VAGESALMAKQKRLIEEMFGIQAELRIITWNRAFDTITEAFKNNSATDIFSIGTTWIRTFCYINYLAPLPGSFRLKPVISPWLDESVRYKGTIYAVPFLAEAYVLMAKQKILDSVGIQAEDLKDWDSFFASCMKITDYFKVRGVEHIPLAFPLRPELGTLHRYAVWLYKGGWEFPKLHAGMERIFRNEISANTLGYITKILRAPGADLQALQTDTQSLLDRFLTTENDFTFYVGNGSLYVSDLLNHRKNNNISLYPLPSLVPNAKTFGGGSAMAVSSTCRQKDLAWKVVEYLTRENILTELCTVNGNIPPYECSFWSQYGDDRYIKVLREQYQNSTAYDIHPLWNVIEQTIGDHVTHYFWNSIVEKDPRFCEAADKTLENMDKEIIDLLNMIWEMQDDDIGRRE
jgi:ABC-type glycerol-3-phosphate transport system substrate-binding protein